MSWEDVNTHQIPFCTYKQTKWKTKNSLFPVAQTVPRSWCSMLFNVSADFGDIVDCSDEACSSVSQQFIPGTLVNQNKTNRRLSLFQMSFPWSLKFTFYYRNYHLERANWNVYGSYWITFYWSWPLQKEFGEYQKHFTACLLPITGLTITCALQNGHFIQKPVTDILTTGQHDFLLAFSAATHKNLDN